MVAPAVEKYSILLNQILRLSPQAILARGPAQLHPLYPSAGPGDLDILVNSDLAPIRAFLRTQGFYRVYKPHAYLERFRLQMTESREPLTIDLYKSQRWGLGFRAMKDNGAPVDPCLACLLHAVADGKGTAYFENVQGGPPWTRERIGKKTFGPLGRALWRLGWAGPLTAYLIMKGVLRPEPSLILSNVARRLSYRLWQLTRNPGLEVALMGVDGAGKTSVAAALTHLPAPVLVINLPAPATVVYMGPHDYHTRIMRFIVKHKLPAPIRQVAFRYDLLTRRISGWLYARRGWIVIYDRHPAERLDPEDKSVRNRIKNAFEHLSAWPVDLTFWLTGDHEAIYLRKKEYTPQKLRATDDRYQRVLNHYKIPFLKLDVVQNNLHAVAEQVGKAVLTKYQERISADNMPKILKAILT